MTVGMNVGQMVTHMRTITGYDNSGSHGDAIFRSFLNFAYRQLVEELSAKYPKYINDVNDLTLTGMYTPLPNGYNRVTRVEDITNGGGAAGGSLDAAGQIVASPTDTVAATQSGEVLYDMSADLQDSRAPDSAVGYAIVGAYIQLIGRDYTGRTLRIFTVGEPDDLKSDGDTPGLIPGNHRMAIVLKAVELLHQRDGSLDDYTRKQAHDARIRMLAGLARVSRLQHV